MILTFGEIMMRVAPPGFLRFRQAMPGSVDITFAGGEANVAASLALFGQPVRWEGQAGLVALRRRPVRLRFHLRQAELYSFETTSQEATS